MCEQRYLLTRQINFINSRHWNGLTEKNFLSDRKNNSRNKTKLFKLNNFNNKQFFFALTKQLTFATAGSNRYAYCDGKWEAAKFRHSNVTQWHPTMGVVLRLLGCDGSTHPAIQLVDIRDLVVACIFEGRNLKYLLYLLIHCANQSIIFFHIS